MDQITAHPDGCRVNRILAVASILTALYLPQSWFFFMDCGWNDYRLSWLEFLPGLPAFFPVALLTHPHDTLMMLSLWGCTGIIIVVLVWASRRHPVLFWVLLACACALSTVSAFGAYSAFRA